MYIIGCGYLISVWMWCRNAVLFTLYIFHFWGTTMVWLSVYPVVLSKSFFVIDLILIPFCRRYWVISLMIMESNNYLLLQSFREL